MRHLLFLWAVAGIALAFHACSPSDSIQPEPPTADFTISTGLPGDDLMTLEDKAIFWEVTDNRVVAGRILKLEAVHKDLASYEWYIHTDITPTATGDTYAASFSLNGLGASEWPVTIQTRLVTSWSVTQDSIQKDTVDKEVIIYDHPSYYDVSYFDTTGNYAHEYYLPPHMGRYKGYLISDPTQEVEFRIDTLVIDNTTPARPPFLYPYAAGLPLGCTGGNCMNGYRMTDRHFTTNDFCYYDFDDVSYFDCGLPVIHGEYDSETQQVIVDFSYDTRRRPHDFEWGEDEWPHRAVDRFIGTKIQ